jgi:hypothetical protein
VQQVRSHESELLQITDLLIGVLTYANRGLATSPAKTAILSRLRASLGQQALSRTSTFAAVKFNILVWRGTERGRKEGSVRPSIPAPVRPEHVEEAFAGGRAGVDRLLGRLEG